MLGKKIVIGFSILLVCSLVSALVVSTNLNEVGVKANDDATWYHYEAIEATETRHGSKEFWANCLTHDFSLIKPDSEHIFEGPALDSTIYFDDLTIDDDRYIAPGVATPKIVGSNIQYGLYPQTYIKDEDLLASLNTYATAQTNSWYLYNGEYYAKVIGAPFDNLRYFKDGIKIIANNIYWFKCEPVLWDIKKQVGDEYTLLSTEILDVHEFHSSQSSRVIDEKEVPASVYKYTSLRSWLTTDFYNFLFGYGSTHIQVTEVDNSASSQLNPDESLASENTFDKIYLFSHGDFKNVEYGFNSSSGNDSKRSAKASDYARAKGIIYSKENGYVGKGGFWVRSPWTSSGGGSINYYGGFSGRVCTSKTNEGIRPAIKIKLNS